MTDELKAKLESVRHRLHENRREQADLIRELAALQKKCPHERVSEKPIHDIPMAVHKICRDCEASWAEHPGGTKILGPIPNVENVDYDNS